MLLARVILGNIAVVCDHWFDRARDVRNLSVMPCVAAATDYFVVRVGLGLIISQQQARKHAVAVVAAAAAAVAR